MSPAARRVLVPLSLSLLPGLLQAAAYDVGPTQTLASISEVPWESLGAGDEVNIHWRSEPYREKWVLCRRGTEAQPIVVRGIPGPAGQRPVISGDGAVTPGALNFWNEPRGLLKIGGSNSPADVLPAHILVEGLHFTTARPGYFFTDDSGSQQEYVNNAAAIYVEKAEYLTIRNCELSGAGNGLFIGANGGQTRHILIQGNFIHDNGREGRYYEHNSYTAAIDITFEYNHYGPLRADCDGNNLKDRSAGLVVRYNWIEAGNRQLDLVDAEDSAVLVQHPSYGRTFVYGNVLIEPDGAGNSQMVHYGGDSGTLSDYRKGVLHFYNNTVVSTRSGNTTLLRLSSNDETAELRNNLVFTSASPGHLAMLSSSGQLRLDHNWLSQGYVVSHEGSGFSGTVTVVAGNIEGALPGFGDTAGQDFSLIAGSQALDVGTALHADCLPANNVDREYVVHQQGSARALAGPIDLGAFERCTTDCARPDAGSWPDTGAPDAFSALDTSGPADRFVVDASRSPDAGAGDIRPVDKEAQQIAQGCDCRQQGPRATIHLLILLGLGLLSHRRHQYR